MNSTKYVYASNVLIGFFQATVQSPLTHLGYNLFSCLTTEPKTYKLIFFSHFSISTTGQGKRIEGDFVLAFGFNFEGYETNLT